LIIVYIQTAPSICYVLVLPIFLFIYFYWQTSSNNRDIT